MAALVRTLTGQSQKSQQTENSSASGLKPPASLQRTTTTDPYSGVLNHLTEPQAEKLVEFKEKLEKDGWWTAEGVNGKPSHDDGTLLRYLRARKFDVNGAYGQFTDTEKWLKEQHVEELYENFDVEHYERARLMYPQWTGHRDKRGIPIYLFVIKHLDSKAVSKYQKEAQAYKDSLPNHKKLSTPAKLLPLFALYHNLLNFVLPFVSSLERPNPEIPVTNSTNIVDIQGVGLTQFWNLKNHMQDASILATAHYPETLDRIFIIGAPAFFPTVWGWIKRWFDPVTVSKIFILSKHEVKPTLEKFMEPKDIPKQYGGLLDFKWGDIPNLDEDAKAVLEEDGNREWVRGPCLWLDHTRIVVGKEKGKLRRDIAEVQKMKPVVYAADDTEEPVHQERRRSSVTSESMKSKKVKETTAAKLDRIQSETVVPTTGAAAATTAIPAETNVKKSEVSEHVPTPVTTEPPPEIKVDDTTADWAKSAPSPVPSNVPAANIYQSAGGSDVNLPPKAEQAAFPQQTAEYISSAPPTTTAGHTSTTKAAPAAAIAATTTAASAATAAPTLTNGVHQSTTSSTAADTTSSSSPPPPGITAPGPTPEHTIAVNKAIAEKLATGGESISVLPAENGVLPHPEMVVTSDRSKGLAVESEKVEGLAKERPGMERFQTAAEF